MYLIAILNDKQIVGMVASNADDSMWVRWYIPSVIQSQDFPRVQAFTRHGDAVSQAKSVVRALKRLSVLEKPSYRIVTLYPFL